ncbi:hypothetical protein [Pseudonocardia spinosispora]|uniref:hypothetical protein n=1 Tax=Pseudonocardia spinosispora TaxID=103441 RepID=UPI00055F73EB|nr:hypothetical protein [Pseudonocardia spinosispora]
MSDVARALGEIGCVIWLVVLTVRHRRHIRQCVDGEPVYRRLPDGRVRFSWWHAAALGECERRAQRAETDVIG